MLNFAIITISGTISCCIWVFIIEPWLDYRPRKGGFDKPRLYPEKLIALKDAEVARKNKLKAGQPVNSIS